MNNWIDKYINMIENGALPTLSENGDVIMQEKIDGVWQNVISEDNYG